MLTRSNKINTATHSNVIDYKTHTTHTYMTLKNYWEFKM